MSVVPASVDTDVQPPLRVPLRHFVVGLVLLVLAGGLGVFRTIHTGGFTAIGYIHLFLAGWVCVTIAGAMTQFVPVWSGVQLYSRTLARLQLVLLTVGVLGVVTGFLTTHFALLVASGGVFLAGFWVFAYNIGRTLLRARPLDVTERHFALALGFFVTLTPLGLLLALNFTTGVLGSSQAAVLQMHATLAVFGAVGSTMVGALYQLATMFTQIDLDKVERQLQQFETIGFPVGVVLLAAGRLLSAGLIARIGGILVALSFLLVSVILLRTLYRTQVPWTPMLSRYSIAAVAMAIWGCLALFAWGFDALGSERLFGYPGSMLLLLLGVIGFVVLGTLYHIVPFLIWVHRYSDQLGLGDVPMIDDLYDTRVSRVDLVLTVSGVLVSAVSELFGLGRTPSIIGSVLVEVGFIVFTFNLGMTIWQHSPGALSSHFDREETPASSEHS